MPPRVRVANSTQTQGNMGGRRHLRSRPGVTGLRNRQTTPVTSRVTFGSKTSIPATGGLDTQRACRRLIELAHRSNYSRLLRQPRSWHACQEVLTVFQREVPTDKASKLA